MKTPEEYFAEHIVSPEPDAPGEWTPEERLFLERYLGVEPGVGAAEQPMQNPSTAESLQPRATGGEVRKAPAVEGEAVRAPGTEERLKGQEVLQFVSFTILGQKYALPISEVQEVIRYVEPTRIPAAPAFIAGMINLRDRVTPLVLLEHLLSLRGRTKHSGEGRFIVVCRVGGLQVGLVIHAVSTMYRIPREDVEFNIESRLGIGSDVLTGLFKDGEKIIGIIAIERLVEKVLRGERHVQAHPDRR
jgi:purine-binding chemotaxis protein CheW